MRLVALVSILAGSGATADSLSCTLCATPCIDPVSVDFDIDRDQFAPPVNAADPPRRKVTLVRMGDAQFPAEPIVMGDARGFWAEGGGGSQVLFITQPDGTAIFVNERAGLRLEGTCVG